MNGADVGGLNLPPFLVQAVDEQLLHYPALYLLCGLFGECNHQDVLHTRAYRWRQTLVTRLQHNAQETLHQHACLAGTRAGGYHHIGLHGLDGISLLWGPLTWRSAHQVVHARFWSHRCPRSPAGRL